MELVKVTDSRNVALRCCTVYPIHARGFIYRAAFPIEKHAPEVVLRVGMAARSSAPIPVTTSDRIKRPSFLTESEASALVALGLD